MLCPAVFGVVVLLNGGPLGYLGTVVFQFLFTMVGVVVSYEIGKKDSSPISKAAFRRVVALAARTGRLKMFLKDSYAESGYDTRFQVPIALAEEQDADINDIIEDWRDIVPREVQEIEEKALQARGAWI